MRRRDLLLGTSATLALSTATRVAPAQPIAWHIQRGVNLWPWFSLTREFPAPRRDYDWPPFQTQRPVPTKQDLQRLAAAGFDFVRLPIDPGPFLSFTGERRRQLISALTNAVSDILSAGLTLVLNVQTNEATHYWNSRVLTVSTSAAEFPAYRKLIGDLAEMLGNFPSNRVALEPVNEPPQACGAPEWVAVQRALLTTARTRAPNLMLVATGSCGSMVSGLTALDPRPFEVLAPILYTFHFYEPYLFSHQGAPWMGEPVYRALNDVPWPGDAGTLEETLAAVRNRLRSDDRPQQVKAAAYAETEKVLKVYFDAAPARPFVDSYLQQVADWGKQFGIAPARILMGEFGALRSDDRYVASGAKDRARYVEDVRKSAEAFGFPWAFWNLFDGMGIVTDDVSRRFDAPILEALGVRVP